MPDGVRRPFLLVHGLSSNARIWDGVGARLAAAGPPRGGRRPARARPLRAGRRRLHDRGSARSISWRCAPSWVSPVTGSRWWRARPGAANVALTLAAEHGGVAALALVDGGWIWLGNRYSTFEACLGRPRPAGAAGLTMAEMRERFQQWFAGFPPEGIEGQLANLVEGPDGFAVARLTREHHREILHSLWADDPRPLFPRVQVPVLLAVAVAAEGDDRPGPEMAASLCPTRRRRSTSAGHHEPERAASPTGWPPSCLPSRRAPRRCADEPAGGDGLG